MQRQNFDFILVCDIILTSSLCVVRRSTIAESFRGTIIVSRHQAAGSRGSNPGQSNEMANSDPEDSGLRLRGRRNVNVNVHLSV